ncbi:MAG: hypothetical protein IKZ81_08105, partial [Clostridia bacterium]|nr:hypothetical protein [Clostridia bacterium]
MLKRIITVLVLSAFMLSLLPAAIISAETRETFLQTQLTEAMEAARHLIFKDNTEQTEKYLYDRYLRAEAALYNQFATAEELSGALAELDSGIELIAPMKGSVDLPLLSFDHLTSGDLALMTGSEGVLRIDAEDKPEGSVQSVEISSEGRIVFDNAVNGGIAGTSPFGMDMTDTDGLRIWVSVDAPATMSLTVGRRSANEDYSLTAANIPVSATGFVTVPYYVFVPDNDGAAIDKSGLMNRIRIECEGASVLKVAGLHSYREVVDVSNHSAYSEERITSRSGIVNNAYYKIYTVDSYGTDNPKAVTL